MERSRCERLSTLRPRITRCARVTRCWRQLLFSLALFAGPPAFAAEWVYTVVDGDSLWNLSSRFLDTTLRYEALRKLNNIERPRHMRPGTRIRIPMRWVRSNLVQARVGDIHGSVELTRADGSRETLTTPGANIGLGDSLRTTANSSIAIGFADGSTVSLHQNSAMTFDHLSAHGDTGMVDSRLRLLEGRLDTRVTPAVGPGSRFEIQTPSAISAVRGTAYRAASTHDGETSNVEVIEGRVAVSGGDRSRLIREGFGTRVVRGKPPTVPRRLLPAPRVTPPAQPIRVADALLQWPPVPGAVRYRVEIGAGAALDVLTTERVIDRPRLRIPDLPDGSYAVRVRAIDDSGLEGHDARITLTLDTHPRPPVPLQPIDAHTLRDAAAELVWTASADATRYRLEIAHDSAFNDLAQTVDAITATRYTASQATQPGTYYWRITSVAADGELGPPSDARSWQVKAIPEAVEAELQGDADGLVATWRTAGADVRYEVQLANDDGFGDLEIDRLTDEARLSIEPMPGQVRYLRIRIVESDGYRGPWGAVQRIDPPPDPFAWIVPTLGALGLLLL